VAHEDRGVADPAVDDSRVSNLELFFDLVFVFGFTQITAFLNRDPTWSGLGKAVLVFLVLWWSWGAYAWLTNAVPVTELLSRIVVLAAMAAMLITALAVPGAFAEAGIAFALGYLVVISLHSALFLVSGENSAATRRAILRLAPTNLFPAGLLVVGAIAGGDVQVAIWVAAAAICYVGPYIVGVGGFTVRPRHFVERHGLVVIMALGESVVAIGAGQSDLDVDWALAGIALLAIVLLSALWWAYFDHETDMAERALVGAVGAERARLARDVFSYLHPLLVFGIVLSAVGLHEALAHPRQTPDGLFGPALGAGVALFFCGLVAIRWRIGERAGAASITAVLAASAIAIASPRLPAAVSLAAVVAVAVGEVLVERWSERRVPFQRGASSRTA
jgi:low temperature requirement protein LtrA